MKSSLPEVVGNLKRPIHDLKHECLRYMHAEQVKPDPDAALIALLADVVRFCQQFIRYGNLVSHQDVDVDV